MEASVNGANNTYYNESIKNASHTNYNGQMDEKLYIVTVMPPQ